MANITGTGGNVALPTGYNANYETWSIDINNGPVDVTGFGDNGYGVVENTICVITGSAAGTQQFDATNTAPLPANAYSSTFAPANTHGTATLTSQTGCTFGLDVAVTNSSLSRSSKPGTKGEVSHSFSGRGALTQTWDETAA